MNTNQIEIVRKLSYYLGYIIFFFLSLSVSQFQNFQSIKPFIWYELLCLLFFFCFVVCIVVDVVKFAFFSDDNYTIFLQLSLNSFSAIVLYILLFCFCFCFLGYTRHCAGHVFFAVCSCELCIRFLFRSIHFDHYTTLYTSIYSSSNVFHESSKSCDPFIKKLAKWL